MPHFPSAASADMLCVLLGIFLHIGCCVNQLQEVRDFNHVLSYSSLLINHILDFTTLVFFYVCGYLACMCVCVPGTHTHMPEERL